MDKTPKISRSIGLNRKSKSRRKDTKLYENTNELQQTDSGRQLPNDLLEKCTLPVNKNDCNIKTPVRNLSNQLSKYSSLCMSPILYESSPELQVGWDDGISMTTDTMSPISTIMPRKKTRRCPEYLLVRSSKSMPPVRCDIYSGETDDDISQYIEWAKSLLESSDTTTYKENDSLNTSSSNCDSKNSSDFIRIQQDLFDDSANETMILCTQKVEEMSVPRTPIHNNKHLHADRFITPEREVNNKRIKLDGNHCDISNVKSEQFSSSSNCNSKLFSPSTENKNAVSQTDTVSLFDEGSELFDSLDFNYLDSLESQQSQQKSVKNKSTVKINNEIKIRHGEPECKSKQLPIRTYSHDEIENRRQEARKKLLFKYRNKTM